MAVIAPWPQRAAPPVRKPKKPKKPGTMPEWMLQAAFIAELHALEAEGWPIASAGDMNAGRRSYAEAAKCKAMGLTRGETDTRIYLPEGKTLLVEIKPRGKKLSVDQEKRHKRLRDLGHNVTTVYLCNEQESRTAARSIVSAWVSLGGWL
ncbi:MAG TPA: hypothetical protein VGN15_01960 [Ktedonobacteraceae bacterium]|nr:hypothetical protein [Ktedonobacteraceae bacterium]